MSTLNFTPTAPGILTNFTVTGAVGGATLKWDASSVLTDVYEVWYNTSNTLTGATKLVTVESNHYTATSLAITTTFYFWVRTLNQYGVVGSYTSSAALIQQSISSANTANSTSTTSSTSTSATTLSPTISAAATWYSYGYGSFTPSANDLTSISMWSTSTITASATGADSVNVWARTRLYDATNSVDVPGGTKQYLQHRRFGVSSYGSTTPIFNGVETFVAGFRGLLVPGNTYRLYIDWRYDLTGSATCTLTQNGIAVSTTSSATMS